MIILSRAVIQLSGNDVRSFLQGLISNDVGLLQTQPALYACLLNPQGKFLHEMFVINGLSGNVYLDVEDGARATDLVQRLNAYKLRRQVKIEVLPDAVVAAVFDTPPDAPWVYPDPRHPDMGWRQIHTDKSSPLRGERYQEWDTRRIKLGIADGSRDAVIGVSTLEELNIVQHHGVSFTKGCYVGQELTARLENRGLAKRHLYPVTLMSFTPISPQGEGDSRDDIYLGDHKIGELRSRCGDVGLALLRDDAVGGQMTLAPTAQGWQLGPA